MIGSKYHLGGKRVQPLTRSLTQPGLLVSVRNLNEARAAIAGGADWIDLKDPQAGALGAVDTHTARQISQSIGGLCPLSAALGELADWPGSDSRSLLDVTELSFLKLGLAGMEADVRWQECWRTAQRAIADAGKSLVAVIYADWQRAAAPPPEQILSLTRESNARYLLIDTFDKNSPGTATQWGPAETERIVSVAKRQGLQVVVAGKVTSEDLTQFPIRIIDLIAVRSAVCRGSRTSEVDAHRVAYLKNRLMQLHQSAPG